MKKAFLLTARFYVFTVFYFYVRPIYFVKNAREWYAHFCRRFNTLGSVAKWEAARGWANRPGWQYMEA